MTAKRVFVIVLDSVGAGEAPDAESFGDSGTNTLRSVYNTGILCIPNLVKLGISNVEGLGFLGKCENRLASCARLRELSAGKDTVVGHWEIAGLVSEKPLPTFPDGFPSEVIDSFKKISGRDVLCNKPYSGTQVIADYGNRHLETGSLIVYTSADSVFQIAAHEKIVPLDELYEICARTRRMLAGEYGVGRVIARPFIGEFPNFARTSGRKDFPLEAKGTTMLDAVSKFGLDTISVGKINDIFAGRGISKAVEAHGNKEGMDKTAELVKMDFHGLCFVNLVDFDMLYGHRNNAKGYAKALNEFDEWLGSFCSEMRDGDVLMITADHGCDPGDISTDHTREYVPLVIYGNGIKNTNLGTRSGFCDISATVQQLLGIEIMTSGSSFADQITI